MHRSIITGRHDRRPTMRRPPLLFCAALLAAVGALVVAAPGTTAGSTAGASLAAGCTGTIGRVTCLLPDVCKQPTGSGPRSCVQQPRGVNTTCKKPTSNPTCTGGTGPVLRRTLALGPGGYRRTGPTTTGATA